MRRRISTTLAIAALLVLASGAAAYAHVSIQPGSAPKGSFSQIAFRVPNETSSTDTVKLQVQIPPDHPMAFVSVKPMPGWKITTKTTKLAKPLKSDDGEVTEAVSEITWEGGKLAPGEYDDFSIDAGPLPTDTDQLVFKAIQTYSDGKEVAWIEEQTGAEEPEHPAPVLKLTDAGDEGATAATTEPASPGTGSKVSVSAVSQDDLDSANNKATIGMVVGILALVAGIGGIVLSRRKTA